MKILIVFNHPAPYKVDLFNELAKSNDLTVLFERETCSNRPLEFYSKKDYNFEHIFLKAGSFSEENCASSDVKNYIKNFHDKFDLIIMNGYSTFAEIKAINYMIRNKIPYSLYINGGVVRREFLFKKLLKTKLIAHAQYYFSPCEKADEYLLHYKANKSSIFHYTYSTVFESDLCVKPLSDVEKQNLRDFYHLPKGKLFVTAGQFIKRKNLKQTIRLFDKVDGSLLLIGNGPLRASCIEYAKKKHLKNIYFIGYLEKKDLFDVLKVCDYYLFLSKEDIYGHATNEAFANALPVIASNKVVSAHALIKDGFNGYIVDLKNDKNIIEKLNKLENSMQINALFTAKNNTIERSVKDHNAIFEKIKK